MVSPKAPSAESPKWTLTRWVKRLIKVDVNTSTSKPTLLAHCLLSIGLVLGAGLLYGSAWASINRLSYDWKVCPVKSTTGSEANPNELPNLTTIKINIDLLAKKKEEKGSVSKSQTDRLNDQLLQLAAAQKTACDIGVFFFSNRNAALTVSTAAGILAITSLAFVSKKGWEDTNNTIINIGVTSGLILFTIWTFSQLYGQGINYESHRIKHALATDLINSVASAAVNQSAIGFQDANSPSPPPALDLNKFTDMATLIRALDSKLEILNKPEFSGDSSFAESSVKRIDGILNPPKALSPQSLPPAQNKPQ